MPTPPARWLIFDADDTLFDYRDAEDHALREAFAQVGLVAHEGWAEVYRTVNARAWRELEAGRLTSARLRVRRFEDLFAELGLDLDPSVFSAAYLGRLACQTRLVDGAIDALDRLRPGHRFAIVTNGLSEVQRPRIAASPLAGRIEQLVISEEEGVAKPDPAIFVIALRRMGDPDPRDVLVVGDSLTSDIAGGIAAGLDTCWFNPRGLERPDGVVPTHEIRRLDELPALVEGRRGSMAAATV